MSSDADGTFCLVIYLLGRFDILAATVMNLSGPRNWGGLKEKSYKVGVGFFQVGVRFDETFGEGITI